MFASVVYVTLLLAAANAFHIQSSTHLKTPCKLIGNKERHSTSHPSLKSRLLMTAESSSETSKVKTTLTESTTWKLRFVMNGVTTTKGRKIDELLYVVNAQFLEDEGYEPPQGSIRQVYDDDASENKSGLNIVTGRWQLSEDPEDRKDGLWIWGLFKEPLYPFLLLQLQTQPIELPGEENDSIGPLKLFAQISHIRDKDEGVILKASVLKIREMETVKADLIGAATVDIFEEVSVGQLSIQAA